MHCFWSIATHASNSGKMLAPRATRMISPIILRLFNTTGPRQTGRYGMVLPNFVTQALKNEPTEVE